MPLFDPIRIERLLDPPVHPAAIAKRALSTISHHLRSPAPQTRHRPQINVPARNGRASRDRGGPSTAHRTHREADARREAGYPAAAR
jgi:hypothetical protein